MINLEKIEKIISLIFGILSILAITISLCVLLKVDRIEELINTSKDWVMNLKLNEPQNNTVVCGKEKVVRIVGKFNFWTTAAEAHYKDRINLTMHQKSVELLCYAKVLSKFNAQSNHYHSQHDLVVNQNGDFVGLVVLGNLEKEKIERSFQIMVLAIPKKSIPRGFVHENLPFYFTASNIVVVKQVHHRKQNPIQ